MNPEDILGDYKTFIQDLINRIQEKGIDIQYFAIDHLCFRVSTLNEYEIMKSKIALISKSVSENIHHNRPIAKFILKNPLKVEPYEVSVIELPAPSPNKNRPTGLEHLEFVVEDNFEEFKEKYKHLWNGFDDSGEYNQPVYINFDNGKTVKFHQYSLLKVLELEGKTFSGI